MNVFRAAAVDEAGRLVSPATRADVEKLAREASAGSVAKAASSAEAAESSATQAVTSASQAVTSAKAADTSAKAAAASSAQADTSAGEASSAAEAAASSATRAEGAATTLNADAREFGDRVRSGEFTGKPGPAPSIKIGTVTSGPTPAATIKGTSPDLTLDLVLAKGGQGDKGDPGAPGVVSSASSYVIVGPGRPDTPSTTGGVITGNEPVGAEYRSTDGANVGAFVWMKRPGGKWEVTVGDTGWRKVSRTILSDGFQFYRRINEVVHVAWGGGQWGAVKLATNYGAGLTVTLLGNRTTAENTPMGFGFTRAVVAPSTDDGKTINGGYYAADTTSVDGGLVQIRNLTSPITTATLLRPPQTSAATHEAWPTAPLPGTPA